MLTTALRKRWPIDDETKALALCDIKEILTDKSAKKSLKMQAIKNLALLDKLNLDEEKMHEPVRVTHLHANVKDLPQEVLVNQIKELLNGLGAGRFIDSD